MQARGESAVYLDVREQNEWNLGHQPKATFLPRGVIETTVEQRVPRDTKVIIYCASGNRSVLKQRKRWSTWDITMSRPWPHGIRKWARSPNGEIEG